MTVHWHEDAETEFLEAAAYYEEQQENLGSRFEAALETALAKVSSYPQAAHKFDGPFQKARLRKFPYAAIYRMLDDENLQIIAVMHLHRKPGYWKSRSVE